MRFFTLPLFVVEIPYSRQFKKYDKLICIYTSLYLLPIKCCADIYMLTTVFASEKPLHETVKAAKAERK